MAAAAMGHQVQVRCPADMVLAGNTCVDRYEGSLVEVLPGGREVGFSPHISPIGHQVRAVSRSGVVPQGHISMVEAQRACKASSKRLCRANEWKTACRGPKNTTFPYGDSRTPGACNDTNRTSPIAMLHPGDYTSKSMNDPRLNQNPNTVELTGSTETCKNGYDVYDMVGNLHEWVDDGAFRGGYYLDTKINGDGCEYRTTAHAPTYYDYSTGFRCCADPSAEQTATEQSLVAPTIQLTQGASTDVKVLGASQGLILIQSTILTPKAGTSSQDMPRMSRIDEENLMDRNSEYPLLGKR